MLLPGCTIADPRLPDLLPTPWDRSGCDGLVEISRVIDCNGPLIPRSRELPLRFFERVLWNAACPVVVDAGADRSGDASGIVPGPSRGISTEENRLSGGPTFPPTQNA